MSRSDVDNPEPERPPSVPDAPVVIEVLRNGPYRVIGPVELEHVDGHPLPRRPVTYLCRCGGSRNKPYCDATHGLKGFVCVETADHGSIEQRRDNYPSDTITVHDDRTRCAHFGQCTDRLAAVFRADAEPFVDVTAASDPDIVQVVRECPSGALAVTHRDRPSDHEEEGSQPRISPIPDGPYRVRGGIPVIDADGAPYEVRERQTLCRCGHSRNKPFCDGSHWYAGFRDPVRPEEQVLVPTVFDYLGGITALEELTRTFYNGILNDPDPILEPIFRGMHPEHWRHVAAWLGETFGGPATYTAEHGGYEHMVAAHLGKAITEQQRRAWLDRLITTADQIGLIADPDLRSTFVAYLEWGSRIALFNSQPDATIIPNAPVPRWGWGQTPPYVPAPWDHPDAAELGRQRYSARTDEENQP